MWDEYNKANESKIADVNNDGKVNGIDWTIVVKDILEWTHILAWTNGLKILYSD